MGVTTTEGRFIFLFRSALFVGLGSVVATIIYLTPIPDQFPQSCHRRCHELDWPMICRVKMVVEELPCQGGECPLGLMVNRRVPGPPIQVCENDILMVDVTNKVPGRSLSVHWRGQSVKETPHMDGVPMVTQCPILPFTTFQYKFRASEAGTHFWQFSPASHGTDNLFGALIVKQSNKRDPHRKLYDTDDRNHVIVLHAYDGRIVISSAEEPSEFGATFNVTSGLRHRFRVLFAGRPVTCRVRLHLDRTPFSVIALDGHPVKPVLASSVELAFGERLDFIIQVGERPEPLELHAEPEEGCKILDASSSALHVLPLNGGVSSSPGGTDNVIIPSMRTVVDKDCEELAATCLNDIEGVEEIPQELKAPTLDNKIFVFFGVRNLESGTNATIFASINDNEWGAPHINNRTMLLPPSPIMTQLEDIDPVIFCDSPCLDGKACECLNVVHIPLGESVEVLLIHQGGGLGRHVFHLHGNSFFVVGARQINDRMTAEDVIVLEAEGQLLQRNLSKPVRRDCVAVPEKGIVAFRFQATNPGYWLLDQELVSRGMQVLLHVGEQSDLPDTPKNYPRCGSWVGPEFFLA